MIGLGFSSDLLYLVSESDCFFSSITVIGLGFSSDLLYLVSESDCFFSSITLRLHYVPGDHGSPKRSAPCDLVNFCLGTQVLLSIITFHHGLSRYPLQTVG